MKIVQLFRAAIAGLLALLARREGYTREGRHSRQRKRNPRRKPVPGQWSHVHANPAMFRGKLNFQRSDPRHLQHPDHDAYMSIAKEAGLRDVVLIPEAHEWVLEQLRDVRRTRIGRALTGGAS